jgi:urease accessory protein UreH
VTVQSPDQLPQSPNQLPDYPITRLPDSSSDSRAPAAIGRHARLELSFERRRGRTILAHSYAEPPFRVGRAFQIDDAAYVILVCTGAGIFAGDTLRLSIRVASGARVVLASQSALQAHPAAAESAATIHHEYTVEDEAELQCQWDPVIPFAGARIDQRFDLRIAESSRMYWSDALMAGRVSRGEAWRFQFLAHELRLRVGASLAYLERYTLAPASRRIEQPWMAGRARYLATAIVHHDAATRDAADALQRDAPLRRRPTDRQEPNVPGSLAVDLGVDLIRPKTIVGRILAVDGAPFAAARAEFQARALTSIFGAPGRVGRK